MNTSFWNLKSETFRNREENGGYWGQQVSGGFGEMLIKGYKLAGKEKQERKEKY